MPATECCEVPDPCEPHHWDARWNCRQREDALALAHEYAADARRELDALLRELDAAARTIKDTAEWLATVTHFKAVADGRESVAEHVTPKEER